MVDKNIKLKEIRRLNSPLIFKNYKAYDSEGNSLKCVENASKIIFLKEPKVGILDDSDILKYTPKSKTAARIRLKKGEGNFSDKLLVNNSLPWILGFYYVILFSLMIPVFVKEYYFGRFLCLILVIIPLFYLFYIFKLKNYNDVDKNKLSDERSKSKYNKDSKSNKKSNSNNISNESKGSLFEYSNNKESFKSYEIKIDELKESFDIKEENVRKLVEKRFKPPQITYDKFMANIDNSHKIFYNQLDLAVDIINLATYSPKVELELENNINSLKLINKQLEDLTNELLINNKSTENDEEIKNLLNDFDDLINSVKDY